MITSTQYTFAPNNFQADISFAVNREAAFMASMMAYAATIYLHTASYASCVFHCGIDSTLIPSPVAASYVRMASAAIFDLLRDSLSNPEYIHSPFFACSQLAASIGSLCGVNECDDWNRAATASNLELAEWALRKQAIKWPCANQTADEIQRMNFSLCAEVDGKSFRLMLGVA